MQLLKDDASTQKLVESLSDIKDVMINFHASMQTVGVTIQKLASDDCDTDSPPKKKARRESSMLHEDDMDVTALL